MSVTFINPETLDEEAGKFIKYSGPFRVRIKSDETGKVYVIDIDDMWSN